MRLRMMHPWKLSSLLFSRPDWLPLGLRGWRGCCRIEKSRISKYFAVLVIRINILLWQSNDATPFFDLHTIHFSVYSLCKYFISKFSKTPLPPPPPPPSKNNDPSLSKDEFERRTSSGSGLLTFVGSDFAQIVALLY